MKKHIITEEEYERVKILAKKNKHKRVEKRLQVIIMRYEGKKADKYRKNQDIRANVLANFVQSSKKWDSKNTHCINTTETIKR